jgi:hypothetical protein
MTGHVIEAMAWQPGIPGRALGGIGGYPHPLAAAHTCTPSACTWGEVGSQYASPGFAVGLAVIAIAVLLIMAARRRTGRTRR